MGWNVRWEIHTAIQCPTGYHLLWLITHHTNFVDTTSTMFSGDSSSRRICATVLLWSWLLFISRCDDALADGGTPELGAVGGSGVEVETVTVTTIIGYNPDTTTDPNDGDTRGGSTGEPTPTSLGTGTSLSVPTAAVSGIQKITSISQPSETLSKLQTSSNVSKEPTSTSTSPLPISTIAPPNTSGMLPSTALGAITGSISGAIILTAGIFLCFRAYKRKKQEEEEENIELDKPAEDNKWHPRRLIPSVIDTIGLHRPRDFDGNDRRATRYAQGGHDANIGLATDGTDFVPTTPALESGAHPRTGLHARRVSAATSPSTPRRDSLYYRLLDEVKAGPAQAQLTNAGAASSAVEWRDSQTPSTNPGGAFNFDFNRKNSGPTLVVTNPTPAAHPEAPLGERAWHRRKLSTTFQPPPSGPPSMPLPPTPQTRKQRSIDGVMYSTMPGSASKPKKQSTSVNSGEKPVGLGISYGLTESTEALIQPKSLYGLEDPANVSTIALGPSPAPTPPPKDEAKEVELLTLPSTRYEAPKAVVSNEKSKEIKVSKVEDAQSPTLPRNSQNERVGTGPGRNLMQVVGGGEQDTVKQEVKGKGKEKEEVSAQAQEPVKRPESSSTIGTSILFPSEDESENETR
ncbi:hypothetical protein F5B19DRAFT_233305 [Rostrohypoxylon terebratum]|nr:hypothetical protein F5B19DRAFT_233305 [Rostrohypoxylon terebratum]